MRQISLDRMANSLDPDFSRPVCLKMKDFYSLYIRIVFPVLSLIEFLLDF